MSLNPSSKYEAFISIIEDILLELFAIFTGHLDILVGVTGFQLNIRMSGFVNVLVQSQISANIHFEQLLVHINEEA